MIGSVSKSLLKMAKEAGIMIYGDRKLRDIIDKGFKADDIPLKAYLVVGYLLKYSSKTKNNPE